MPFDSSSCAAAYSGERLRSDENEASVINACARVVSIACDLFNKLAIGFEDLFVGAVKVNTVGKISQRLVANPAKNWRSPSDIQNLIPSQAVKSSMCRSRGIALLLHWEVHELGHSPRLRQSVMMYVICGLPITALNSESASLTAGGGIRRRGVRR